MKILLILPVLFISSLAGSANVIADNDLLMTAQRYGETKINTSVSGTPLRIAGKEYTQGIGTHATSMIPLTVPNGSTQLTGACGIDDKVAKGSVAFSIMSGSEVVWTSGTMNSGMPAKEFSIKILPGTRKLYLLADHVENNDEDHANWVNLTWEKGKVAQSTPVNIIKTYKKDGKRDSSVQDFIKASDFGMKPGVKADQGKALRRAISAARQQPNGCKIIIPKGVYHFYPENALKMSFHVSNHDQPTFHPVCIPLVDLKNVTLEGNGSVFLFHGMTQPLLIMDSQQIKVSNLSIDYARQFYTESIVTKVDDKTTTVRIDPKKTPFKINNKRFTFIGEEWEMGVSTCTAFEKETGRIIEGTSDLSWSGEVEDLGNGLCELQWNLQSKGIKPGDVLVFRTWDRPHPACVLYRSEKTNLINLSIHNSQGMGILAQRSTDISISGGGIFIRKGSGKAHCSGADATHFSNTRGTISVKNAFFEGMMDDAINVHSTCLGIEEIVSPNTIRCRYKHAQAVGFEVFLPGEKLQFIAGTTLETGKSAVVKSVRKLNTEEILITLDSPLPPEVKKGDAVENSSWYPSVVFTGNTVRNNRARGALFNTPKSVVVHGNLFDHSSGSAILIAGDAQGWYESGACENVTITGNKFINNLTSRYQFTNAIISICPEIRNLGAQKKYYHRKITISGNQFDTFDVPLVFAISTENIKFTGNTIRYNNDFKSWGKKPFEFIRCLNINISGNTISPPKTWTIDDCELRDTPKDTITIRP